MITALAIWSLTQFQDDGKPDQYDLPPPQSAAAAQSANASAEKTSLQNGAPPEEEDQWSKLGWAPRFGSGETEEDKTEVSLLDHQTFLEGKLDEKFFGGACGFLLCVWTTH